jgi:hypothetical protein
MTAFQNVRFCAEGSVQFVEIVSTAVTRCSKLVNICFQSV